MKLLVEEQKRKTKGEPLEGQVKSGRPTILTTDEEAGARFIENIRAYSGSVFASLLWFQAQVIRRNAWIPVPYNQHGPTSSWNGRVGYRLGTTAKVAPEAELLSAGSRFLSNSPILY